MKGLIRVAIVVASAAGFFAFLSSVASADVVEPESALQPASAQLMQKDAASDEAVAAKPKPLEETFYGAEQEQTQEAQQAQEVQQTEAVPATPAPEQVVGRAPTRMAVQEEPSHGGGSVLDRAVQPLRAGFHQIGAYLGRVANACQVGLGSGAGGPVLVLGVLCMAIALERRWVLRAQSATDEDVPEFLFAQELTPPG